MKRPRRELAIDMVILRCICDAPVIYCLHTSSLSYRKIHIIPYKKMTLVLILSVRVSQSTENLKQGVFTVRGLCELFSARFGNKGQHKTYSLKCPVN